MKMWLFIFSLEDRNIQQWYILYYQLICPVD